MISYVIATILSLFLSYTFFALLVHVLYYKILTFKIDYHLLFFKGNLQLFLIATLIGLFPVFIYATNKFKNIGQLYFRKDKADFNQLLKPQEVKKKYLRITFDKNGIILTKRDRLEIEISKLTSPWNKKIKKIIEDNKKLKFLNYLKLYERKRYLIGDTYQWYRAGFIIMSKGNTVWVDPSESHTLTVGTTNSGKTVSILLPLINLIRLCGESGVIVDMKGDISQLTYDAFVESGYRVLILDFINPELSDGWNPLSMAWVEYKKEKDRLKKLKETLNERLKVELENYQATYGTELGFDPDVALGQDENGNPHCVNGEIMTYADFSKAAEIVNGAANAVTADPTSKQRFWNSQAATIMEGLIFLLLEEGVEENVSLSAAKALFDEGNQLVQGKINLPNNKPESYLKKYVMETKTPSDISYEKLNDYLTTAEDTAKGMMSTFNERVNKILMSTQIKNILATNEIDLTTIDDQKTIIFLKVHDEKETYYPLVNIFMEQLQQSLIERARTYPSLKLKYPFNFLWDEFARFPKYEAVDSLVGAGRSRGIRLNLVIQGYDQLDSKYGPNMARSIKNGCMIKTYLLSDDEQTLEDISKTAGHKLSKDKKEPKKRIFTVERLRKFQYGDTLILRQKENPFFTKMIPYYEYIYYKKANHIFKPKPHKYASTFDITEAYRNLRRFKYR
ncbi:type IV secretory system conjugative DNA transfer family protein [Eggerthia catenaformis]|uniref:type IV secretory system conjugative DNA transfer family protein n=1 Tax=Eggerthia catenaformis TaxID=31973 RepID=UPI00248D75CB|nr:type IV secretory system conjugative DNA transfer family protein [Eggerthia catenaformis]